MNNLIPKRYPLVIKKGATFDPSFQFVDKATGSIIPLTGYTGRMQIRASYDSETVLLELTAANGRLTVDEANGIYALNVAATDTAALTWTTGVYDIELVNGATVRCPQYGPVTVIPEVTR